MEDEKVMEERHDVSDGVKPEPTITFGIDETLDIIDSLVKIGNAINKSMEDGEFNTIDLFNFTGAMVSLPSALTGIGMVPNEMKDLDSEEIKILVDEIADNLDYADDEDIKLIIDDSLNVVLSIKQLIAHLKNMTF